MRVLIRIAKQRMKSLLLVAHGSRRGESNQEVATVASSLRDQVNGEFAAAQYAFLELAEPSIPQAIDDLISQGAEEIVVLPYFLSAGRHVHEDIPTIIADKQKQYPQVKIALAPYLGEAVELVDVLVRLSQQAHV